MPKDVNRQFRISGPKSGNIKWELPIHGQIVGNSSLEIGIDGNIIFGTQDGTLYSVLPSGLSSWTINLGLTLLAPSIGLDGMIYIGSTGAWESTNNKVFAIRKDGSLVWSFLSGRNMKGTPIIHRDGDLLVVTEGAHLICIDQNGQQRWTYQGTNEFWLEPVVSPDNLIFIADTNEDMHVLNTEGELQNKFKAGIGRLGSKAIISHKGDLFFTSNLDRQIELLRTNGKKVSRLFKLKKEEDLWPSPSLSSTGIIYVPANYFRLMAVDLEGSRLWEMKMEGFINSPPIIDQDGLIYFTTITSTDGNGGSSIYCISPQGDIVWKLNISGEATTPIIGLDKTIYVLTNQIAEHNAKLIAISE